MLNEGKNIITEVGVFPQIAKYIKDGRVFISRDIEIKCKTKHKIGNLEKFVADTLNNHQFTTPYQGNKHVLNFYGLVVNKSGRIKYQKVAISKMDGRVLTAYSVTKTHYLAASSTRIV